MRKNFAILAVLLPLAAAPLRAQTDPAVAFRLQFKPYEQWMLDVVLSDPKQKAAWDASAVNAAKSGDDDTRELMKWRKTLISFVEYYKKELDTTDIVPNAPSVEKMVTPEEFNVTQYYWLRQPKDKQAGMKSDIATGNNLLNWGGRKLVESKVRAGRVTFSGDLGQYLNDPDSKKALAWVEPPSKPAPVPVVTQQPLDQPSPAPAPTKPPPKPIPAAPKPPPKPQPTQTTPPAPTAPPVNPTGARDQAESIARNSVPNGAPEGSAERAGSGFTGSGAHPPPAPTPVDATGGGAPSSPPDAQQVPSLPPPAGAPSGGFVVAPPPSPVLDQEKPVKEGGSKFKILAVKYGPGVLGAVGVGLLFGFLAAMFLGPIGAIAVGLAGAALGYKGGQMLGRKLLGS